MTTPAASGRPRKPVRTRTKVLVFLMGLLFAGVGAAVLVWGAGVVREAQASESWPTAPGRVLSARMTSHRSDDSTTYGADVQYEYMVDGVRYTGDRVHFGQYSTSDRSYARGILKRYPKGKAVKVYHDPDRPDRSILEPGAGGAAWITPILGGVFLLAGAGMLVLAVRMKRLAESEALRQQAGGPAVWHHGPATAQPANRPDTPSVPPAPTSMAPADPTAWFDEQDATDPPEVSSDRRNVDDDRNNPYRQP